jgi:hypothetical protein
MYIRKEDFAYLECLCKSLHDQKKNDPRKERFLNILLKAGKDRTGQKVGKINVVDDSVFDERGIEPQEFITRTMIRKAYKEAKGE